jgi:SSS family solute:Na+ symporter
MIAALLAALMSSLSSVFNSCSTLITMDIYKKVHPEASEQRLVFIGRVNTAIIVGLSIAWIPFIRYLSDEIYQYLQSVQSYIGAPITATFVTGIVWRGATARAALTTLVFGGFIGATRFLLDILHKALGYDLGPLNAVVNFSFLNFSVIVFFACIGLMVLVSRLGEKPLLSQVADLTLDWSRRLAPDEAASPAQQRLMVTLTGVIGLSIVMLWYHFR